MRICILAHRLSRRPGGSQIFTLEFAKLLSQYTSESNVDILTWGTDKENYKEGEKNRIRIIRFKLPFLPIMYREVIRLFFKNFFSVLAAMIFYIFFSLRPLFRVLINNPMNAWQKCLTDASRGLCSVILTFHELLYLLNHNRYDIIQAHELSLGIASSFIRLIRRKKVPIIYTYLTVLTEPFFLELEAELVRYIDGAILFNDGGAEVKFKKWGVPREKIFITSAIIPCKEIKEGLTQRYGFKHIKRKLGLINEKIVLHLGRIAPEKDIDQIINAFDQVLKKIKNVKLVLCGPVHDETYQQTLIQHIRNANMEKQVIFTGPVPHNEVPLYYLMSDVVVFSSPIGNVTLTSKEAMLAGKPIVASNAFGTGNIILDGKVGLLFDHGNVKQFCDKIVAILTNPKLSNKLGAAAKRYAEQNFCLEKIIPLLIARYKNIIKSRIAKSFRK
jgi:glycosyltransferase involved in cell wall biosynthesis